MNDILDKIEQIARMAGFRSTRTENALVFGFDLDRNRTQVVHVLPFGEGKDGTHVICFLSPCQQIKKGLLSGMSKSRAVDLLRMNGRLPFGHFAMITIGGEELVCVRATQILETMEVQEFEANCFCVAQAADEWEKTLGQDVF